MFSDAGRERRIESLCQKAANKELCTWVGLYTCSPYTFVLGIHKQSFFLVDTHCIAGGGGGGSIIGGNGNGILVVTKDCSPSVQELLAQRTKALCGLLC